jgi:hypothetical protein
VLGIGIMVLVAWLVLPWGSESAGTVDTPSGAPAATTQPAGDATGSASSTATETASAVEPVPSATGSAGPDATSSPSADAGVAKPAESSKPGTKRPIYGRH